MVTVRFDPLPPKRIFASGTRPGLDEWPLTIKLSGRVSTSPMENGMAAVGVSSSVDWFATLEMVGGSFTGLTVRTNEVLADAPSESATVMIMVAAPFWLVIGVMVMLRLDPLPLMAMFPSRTNAGLEELQVTTRFVAAVWPSLTLNATPARGVFSSVVWLAILEMVGGLF